jgi:hypothetical protein
VLRSASSEPYDVPCSGGSVVGGGAVVVIVRRAP